LATLAVSSAPMMLVVFKRINNPRLNTVLFLITALVLSGAVVTLIKP
jgi:hypothetical protein